MRLTLVAAGRWKRGPLPQLFDDYAKRLSWPLALRQVVEKKPLQGTELAAAEGAAILAQVPREAVLVALDAGGRTLSSEAFAQRLGDWRDGGVREVAFAVGGADGLSPEVLARADLTLSLGAMTWPHLLARVLLAEQLYRAQSILQGHPYHR